MRKFLVEYKKETQVVLEFIIVLAGILLDWGLALMLFYFMLDLLGKYILLVLQWRKLSVEGRVKSKERRAHQFQFIGLAFAVLFAIYALLSLLDPPALMAWNPDNLQQILDAAQSEIWIVPLVLILPVMAYRTDFVMMMEWRMVEVRQIVLRRMVETLPFIFIPAAMIATGLRIEWLIVLLLGIGKLGVDFAVVKLEKRQMNKNITKGY